MKLTRTPLRNSCSFSLLSSSYSITPGFPLLTYPDAEWVIASAFRRRSLGWLTMSEAAQRGEEERSREDEVSSG